MKWAQKYLIGILLWITFEAKADVVIGIHGFLSNAHSMIPIKKSIEFSELKVCLWQYPSRSKFIEEHACDLVALLQKFARIFPGRPIHFVAHSIGALVLRSTLNTPSCPIEAKIGRIVLIAPPNQGCCLARRFSKIFPINALMGNKSGWELRTYDPERIALSFGSFPSTASVLVIAGTRGNSILFDCVNDGYVRLDETQLNTPSYFACFPVSHGDLLSSAAVLSCLRNFIINEQSTSPSPLSGPGNLRS